MKPYTDREEAKTNLLYQFINDNETIKPMKSFICCLGSEYDNFDFDLYDMAHELVKEGKLVSVKIYIPDSYQLNETRGEKDLIEWILPPGSKVLSEDELIIRDIIE